MTTRECVANRIIELCRERNMTINGLARLSALPPSTLKNIVNGVSQNPGIVTIKKLCDGLEITLIEFFDTEEFRALEQEIQLPCLRFWVLQEQFVIRRRHIFAVEVRSFT